MTICKSKKICAGEDIPRDNFSFKKTREFEIPIYANGFGKNERCGNINIGKIKIACVAVLVRGVIGYAVARSEPFFQIVRLLA